MESIEWKKSLVQYFTDNLRVWLCHQLDSRIDLNRAKEHALEESRKVKYYPYSPCGEPVPANILVWYQSWLDMVTGDKEQEEKREDKELTRETVREMINEALKAHVESYDHKNRDDITKIAEDTLRTWDVVIKDELEEEVEGCLESKLENAIDEIDFESRVKSVLRDIASDF